MSEPASEPMGTAPAASPTAALWHRLERGTDPAEAVAALTGLSRSEVRARVAAAVASSAEATALLAAMPTLVRRLAVATTVRTERCRGEVRGPVLWSETMSARSSSWGDEGLFVCASPRRAYDTSENRVLVAALAALGSPWLEHRALADVAHVRPTARDRARARAGQHRRTYRPALDLLARVAAPVGPDDVAGWADRATLDDHDLAAAALEGLERRGAPVAAASVTRGAYACGPLTYRPRGGVWVGRSRLVGIRSVGALEEALRAALA